jgi:tetratricopeptide (TPR) repeat protein
VEGSVRKAGDQLRITAQLIDVASDSHIWSQTYDRQMQNVFAIQNDIAASVADALKSTLEGGETFKTQVINPRAYNVYLQGRYFWDRRSKEDLEKAIGYYEQALQLEPNYARAWASLGAVRFLQVSAGYVELHEGYTRGRNEVEKALELDPNLAEGYAFRGWVKRSYDWDWTGADADYRRALELEPGNVDAVRGAAFLAATQGNFEEAIAMVQRAIEIDPLRGLPHYNLGGCAYYSGRWNLAEEAIRKTLELNPQYPAAHTSLFRIYLAQSRLTDALNEIQKEPQPIWREYGLTILYHARGKKMEADVALAQLIEKYQNDSAFQIAEIYAFRGEKEKAFAWLERAYNQKDVGLTQLKGDPLLRSLESDPRHRAFLQKMKLPLD